MLSLSLDKVKRLSVQIYLPGSRCILHFSATVFQSLSQRKLVATVKAIWTHALRVVGRQSRISDAIFGGAKEVINNQ